MTSREQVRDGVRDETGRIVELFIENCFCVGAPQPSISNLRLDEHHPYCVFVELMETEQERLEKRKETKCNTN